MNLRFLSVLSLLANAAAAQDYFPLQVGNQWVYRSTSIGPERRLSLTITESQEIAGNTYYRLTGLPPGPHWLRMNETGALLAFDEQQQRDRLWYDFAAAASSSYDTAIPSCCGRATVVSRSAIYDGPLGRLNNALELTYPGVFQIGIVREQFLPWIGLVFREENTGGPGVTRHELVYARVRGNNVFTTGEASFRLSLGQNAYRAGSTVTARLTMVNTTGQPVRIPFPSTQRFDLAIRSAAGATVYQWSADKLFAAVAESVDFRGETHWIVTAPLDRIPAGRYSVEAWLASEAGSRWRALSSFEVTAGR